MGGWEDGALALLEPTVEYHNFNKFLLTYLRVSGVWTVLGGQFDWGGCLLKSNGGAQRYT